MSFCRTLRTLAMALFCAASAAATAHAQLFPQPTVISTGNWPVAVYSADVNEDGKPDLIYIDYGATPASSTTHILLNNGDGTFHAGATLATAGSALAIGHFDSSPTDADPTRTKRDTHVDIGWVKVNGNSLSAFFAYGNGDGTFIGPVPGNITQVTPNPPRIVSLAAAPYITGQADFLFAIDAANGPVVDVFYRLSFYSRPLPPNVAGQIQSADLNSDGMTDYVITTPGAAANVFFGIPPPSIPATFPAHATSYGPGAIASSLIADIDGDGIPDLVVEGANGALSYFPGTSTGFSSSPLPISGAQDGTTGNGGHLVAIANLTSSFVPDIITSTPAGISVLIGQPPLTPHTPYSPKYTLGGIYNAGPGRSSYALADFNGDGHLDLALDSPEGIAILFGNADGSFQTSRSYAAGQPAYSLSLGRFTGTNFVDALVATGIPQVQLLSGDDKGAFAVTTPASPAGALQTNSTRTMWSSALPIDFNGDSKLDIVTTKIGKPPAVSTDGMTVQIGQGDGTFGAPITLYPSRGNGFGASTAADFDGNGTVDLVNFDSATCSLYPGTGSTIAFGTPLTNNANGYPYNLVASGYTNFSNPGRADVVCVKDGIPLVFHNNGAGVFPTPATLPGPSDLAALGPVVDFPASGVFAANVLFSDIDGDGFGDVVVLYHNLAADPAHPTAATSNRIYIHWGNGDGTFAAPTILSTTRNYYEAAIVDIDGDFKPDLILSDGYVVSVMKGQGSTRTFGPEQHYLAGMGINGIATYPVAGLNAIVVANGGAVFSNPAINHGTLASNADVNTGGVTVLLKANVAATLNGTVTASPEPSLYGDNFTLTATLTPSDPTGPSATGTVTFSVDGSVVGMGTVTAGMATYALTLPTYAVGTHTVTAVYSGDGTYPTLTLAGSHDVALQPSTTYLTALDTPIHYGEIIGDLAVAHADPLNPTYTQSTVGGTITVYIDGVNTCVLLVGNSARCPDTTGAGYNVGTHTIYLLYSGNAYFAGSTSITYTATIIPDDTVGTVTSALNPANAGQAVQLTATFSSAFAVPAGTVTFLDGSTVIGVGTLNAAGSASFTTSTLAVGTHNITAVLGSSLNFNGSTTPVLQQVINPPPEATSTMLASSVNPSVLGQTVMFTAVVSPALPVAFALSGSVTFMIDGATAAIVPLSGSANSASFNISTLPVGSHSVIAIYSGTSGTGASFLTSTSSTLIQVVTAAPPAPGFTMTVTPAAITVPIGNTVTVLVTVAALNGFNQPVALSCGSLPREVTCTFGTNTIANGSGVTSLTVHATAPHDCGSSSPYYVGGSSSWIGLVLSSSLILLIRRRRRVLQGIFLTLALCILPLLSGCGQCTDLGVWPGNYTFTVIGTTGTGAIPVATPGSPVNETVTQIIKMVARI